MEKLYDQNINWMKLATSEINFPAPDYWHEYLLLYYNIYTLIYTQPLYSQGSVSFYKHPNIEFLSQCCNDDSLKIYVEALPLAYLHFLAVDFTSPGSEVYPRKCMFVGLWAL